MGPFPRFLCEIIPLTLPLSLVVPRPGALDTVDPGHACKGTQASQTGNQEPADRHTFFTRKREERRILSGSDESDSMIFPTLGASWSEQGASMPQKTVDISSN